MRSYQLKYWLSHDNLENFLKNTQKVYNLKNLIWNFRIYKMNVQMIFGPSEILSSTCITDSFHLKKTRTPAALASIQSASSCHESVSLMDFFFVFLRYTQQKANLERIGYST